MKTDAELKLASDDREALEELLGEEDMSVSKFAVIKAKVHPQTVYNARNGEALKPKSYKRITGAIREWRTTSRAKTAV